MLAALFSFSLIFQLKVEIRDQKRPGREWVGRRLKIWSKQHLQSYEKREKQCKILRSTQEPEVKGKGGIDLPLTSSSPHTNYEGKRDICIQVNTGSN